MPCQLSKKSTFSSLLFAAVLLAACGSPANEAAPAPSPAAEPGPSAPEKGAAATAEALPAPPALPGAMTPNWAAGTDEPLLSWLEPAPEGGMRLRVSRLREGSWSQPATVTSGEALFANWADFPSVAAAPSGEGTAPAPLFAHWLARTGEATYAYGVQLARSRDGGATWEPLGSLHADDASPTEHGFVSLVPEPGGVRAFWLDGRRMVDEGLMSLRTALLSGGADDGAVGAGRRLDDRVCDCCQTGAARSGEGTVVVYRDRSDDEVRDIYFARIDGPGDMPAGRPVAEDGWHLPGCPVNGPAVAAAGEGLAVAWFTGAADPPGRSRPRVQAAFLADGDAGFGTPILIDGDRPLGRVGIAPAGDGGAVISWLAHVGGGDGGPQAELRVVHAAPDGRLGTPLPLARVQADRASGFPRLARHGDALYLAWRDLGDEADDRDASRIEVRRLPPGTPAPAEAR